MALAISIVKALIDASAYAHGVDPALARAIAWNESRYLHEKNGKINISSTNDIGVMQLRPATAKTLGVDPYDLHQNIDGGVRMIHNLLSSYHGDVRKALYAYNWGSGNLASGKPVPGSVQKYASRVLARAAIERREMGKQDSSVWSGGFPLVLGGVLAAAAVVVFSK